MHILYISTYPPRQCGIATFTQNLIKSAELILDSNNFTVSIAALHNVNDEINYPQEVKYIINQFELEDYKATAAKINESDIDLVIVQHEYGIFGGNDGLYILSLLNRLKVPFVNVFHTILKEPSYSIKYITKEISRLAAGIVVMSNKGKKFLNEIYDVPSTKIKIIQHGVPDYILNDDIRVELKKKHNLCDKKVMLTFGLISRNKGIETAIEALPKVVAQHPDLLYIILGATHPSIIKVSGEEYRNYLIKKVNDLGMQDNVRFINSYLEESELFEYLAATDLYVTPYLNEAQITSGTLSYAVGAGAAVLSTPYWHAQELLANGRGKLFDFKGTAQLSNQLLQLLNNPTEMEEMRQAAFEFGQANKWSLMQNKYFEYAEVLIDEPSPVQLNIANPIMKLADLRKFNLNHLYRLTDSTGVLQHARYGLIDYKEGYTLDDNARALIVALKEYKKNKSEKNLNLVRTYLSFIHYMQNVDGSFRNFLSYSREYLDNTGTQDALGRTIWALGYTVQEAPDEQIRAFSREMFLTSIKQMSSLTSIRSWANSILGITRFLQEYPTDEVSMAELIKLTDKLMLAYASTSTHRQGWVWFEASLTYDNGLLPLALAYAYDIIPSPEIKEACLKTCEFITNICFKHEHLSLIGNEKWYDINHSYSEFGQQPVDAMNMVLMYRKMYKMTGDSTYLVRMCSSYKWFIGKNTLSMSLYDPANGTCFDGLESYGINSNQGAESTLAYLISHQVIEEELTQLEQLELINAEQKQHTKSIAIFNKTLNELAINGKINKVSKIKTVKI